MTALAIFNVSTDISPTIIAERLNNIWIGQEADAIPLNNSTIVSCGLMYFYNYVLSEPKYLESVKNVVNYLLDISNNELIYYYPNFEVYDMSDSDNDETVEISVNDIFTEKYQPSMNSPLGYARFVIKKKIIL